MLKVELIPIDENLQRLPKMYRTQIDGFLDETSYVYTDDRRNFTNAFLKDESVVNHLFKYSFAEVKSFFNSINYDKSKDKWNFTKHIRIEEARNAKMLYLTILLNPHLNEWNKPFSFLDFEKKFEEVERINRKGKFSFFRTPNEVNNDFGIRAEIAISPGLLLNPTIISSSESIESVLAIAIDIIDDIIVTSIAELLQNIDKDIIVTYFEFPEEIKIASKQYLIYFAQFLKDLGIDADTEITEEAQSTLFKVIPRNKGAALEQIRKALSIYLNAPSSSQFANRSPTNNDVAILQWKANVDHLRGQLTLADAVLQAKEATIQSLTLTNYQLQKTINQNSKLPGDDLYKDEEVIKDIVSVKQYDGKWLSVNLPEIFRRLKRKF